MNMSPKHWKEYQDKLAPAAHQEEHGEADFYKVDNARKILTIDINQRKKKNKICIRNTFISGFGGTLNWKFWHRVPLKLFNL